MLPTLVQAPPEGDDWLHEIKHDGYRTELIIEPDRCRSFTRRGHDWSRLYRHIVDAARELDCASAIIDGEVIIQDAQGRSDFHALRAEIASTSDRLIFYAFDLLWLDGRNLRSVTLADRKALLLDLIGVHDPAWPIQFSSHVVGGGGLFFEAASQMGLEGIVSKRCTSRYASGRTKAWVKTKAVAESEFVVIGTSKGERAPVALLAAETDDGLVYAGAAMVTLPDLERETFWRTNEALKTTTPAVPMEPRKETSWLRPEMKVRVRHLRGEEMLRHATVQAITALPKPGHVAVVSSKPTREPTYRMPHITKEEMRAYYEVIAPAMLPWVKDRPLNLFRCSKGRCFFQRNRNHPETDEPFGEPIHQLPILQKNGRTESYLWISDTAGVMACVEADTFEFHGWGARITHVEKPDRIAFDLDPGEGTTFADVKAAATQFRRSLDAIGLKSWPMVSGGKGIHVVVPLAPAADWPEVRRFAKDFCTALAEAAPDRFTVSLPKKERVGRILLDFHRNQRTATAVLPYSARARDSRGVAAPITWDELAEVAAGDQFTISEARQLLTRSRSRLLRGWSVAEQQLPTIGAG
jgi:bifunctional non-homologous end joining protein LigD